MAIIKVIIIILSLPLFFLWIANDVQIGKIEPLFALTLDNKLPDFLSFFFFLFALNLSFPTRCFAHHYGPREETNIIFRFL